VLPQSRLANTIPLRTEQVDPTRHDFHDELREASDCSTIHGLNSETRSTHVEVKLLFTVVRVRQQFRVGWGQTIYAPEDTLWREMRGGKLIMALAEFVSWRVGRSARRDPQRAPEPLAR